MCSSSQVTTMRTTTHRFPLAQQVIANSNLNMHYSTQAVSLYFYEWLQKVTAQ